MSSHSLNALDVAKQDHRANRAAKFLADMHSRGVIDHDEHARAIDACNRSGQQVGVVLTELGLLSEAQLIVELSTFFRLPIITAQDLPEEPVAVDLEPAFLLRNRVLPVKLADHTLQVAIADPFDANLLASIAYHLDLTVLPRLVSARELDGTLMRLYPNNQPDDLLAATALDDDIERLKEAASEAPVVRLVARLLADAVLQGASDIHIESLSHVLTVRHRIDGLLVDAERIGNNQKAAVTTRLKILANLNIAERRLPQDGRTKAMVAGRQIDIRVSCVPTQHGESIVLRLLDQDNIELSFDRLGLDGFARSALEQLLQQPNGIILVTGPTGSGKTTTLYAALKLLNSRERKVFSVEDPIEYELAGVNQLQIKHEIGLDFVQALRSILRQDPDVIMVGEIRDVETAKTAIQASLTGHLVLSTLHTNGAAAALTRLIDMGVEPYLLASSLTGALAQRLVRRLCRVCSQPADDGAVAIFTGLLDEVPALRALPRDLRRPIGCPECRGTGYQGRTAIAEALVVNDRIRAGMVQRRDDREVEQAARADGMELLVQSGLRKAFAGETTVEEVLRVARM